MSLNLCDNLKLPIEAVTEKLAFLGRTGSGKTYAAQRLAELMHKAGAQFVALDPVGKWWSLRLADNGKDQGIPLPVFGGLHGDVPLEPSGGSLVADIIVDRNLSAVVDVSQFESDTDKASFARDFGARFFFRKKASPSAVHIFIEEAQEFVPQNTMKGEEKMLHVWTRIQKLGRNFGIGTSLLSQRPQEVNKKVLNQTELLFVFQLTGPQEREAIADWIEEKGIDEDIAAELPKLKLGSPHAWSPAWLQVSKVVTISEKWTYDASSTPKVGARGAPVKELSPIDLEKLHADMKATIERAKQDDPKLLRQQIAELKKQLSGKAPAVDTQATERAVASAIAARDRDWKATIASHERVIGDFKGRLGKIASLAHVNGEVETIPVQTKTVQPVLQRISVPPKTVRQTSAADPEVGGGGLRRMLTALAQRNGLSARQLGIRAALSSKSGTFSTYLARARTAGWIEGDKGGLEITTAGLTALGDWEPLPEGRDLANYWLGELGDSGAARMLRTLIDSYPKALTKDELGERCDLSASSGTFSTYLSRLRSLELIERRELRASEELFA